MSIWFVTQLVFNLILGAGLFLVWTRLRVPAKDDPRLSRGLQLLQSKISVLEDLSDRTDNQVKQLTELIEQKTRGIQKKVIEAERQVQLIDQAMQRSLEVAEIFQDKIPHKEIIERQDTIKYVTAARMAHRGASIEEIAEQVDLPREQLEFIAKVNKDELMFDEESLPPWAREMENSHAQEAQSTTEESGPDDFVEGPRAPMDYSKAFEIPEHDYSNLQKVGEEFRKACEDHDKAANAPAFEIDLDLGQSQLVTKAKDITRKVKTSAQTFIHDTASSIDGSEMKKKLDEMLKSAETKLTSQDSSRQGPQAQPALQEPDKLKPDEEKVSTEGAESPKQSRPAKPFSLEPSKPSRVQTPIFRVSDPEVRNVEFPKIDLNKNLE